MKKLILILMLFGSLSIQAQTKYQNRTKGLILGTNIVLSIYANQKQFYLPVQTQKWLNPLVYIPAMGFTIYKTLEYHKRNKLHRI